MHGLDEAAAAFLGGETLSEVEDSARRFKALVGKSEQGPSGDLFTDAVCATQIRKAALVDLLVGRPRQPRDEDGRYAPSPPTFDGASRESAPPAPPSHGQWLAEVLRHRKADAGAHF